MPNIVRDSTLATPPVYNDVMYLMYSYCGDFTPIVFTPAVIENQKMYEQKHYYDIYSCEPIE